MITAIIQREGARYSRVEALDEVLDVLRGHLDICTSSRQSKQGSPHGSAHISAGLGEGAGQLVTTQRDSDGTLTLAELLPQVPLNEPLQRRHDELHRLVRDLRAPLGVVRQHPRHLVPLRDLVQEVEEAVELLLHRTLPLVLLVDERLQQRREVRVKVARLGDAKVAVQQLLRRPREDRGDRGALDEQLRAQEGDVVEQEDRAERGPLVHAREREQRLDHGVHDVVCESTSSRVAGKREENVQV